MGWTILGWLLAKLAATACALPGVGGLRADAMGRAARAHLPWRLSSECSRALASGAGARVELSWLAMGLAMAAGLAQMLGARAPGWGLAGLAAGASIPWALARARKSPRVAMARARLWLAMLSSSELGASMGHWPAGPEPGMAGKRLSGELGLRARGARRRHWHAGFVEMARRLCSPMDPQSGPEPAHALRARARLRAMMLACAGSEQAARWLWRRRGSQWSMARWAKSFGEGAGGSGDRWEMAAAIMSVSTMVAPWGGGPVEMDASEATESSIPMLWATSASMARWREGGDFEVGVRRECLRVAAGEAAPVAPWGGRAEEEAGAKFKKRLLVSMRSSGPAWRLLAETAAQLLEREQLGDAVAGAASAPERKERARL